MTVLVGIKCIDGIVIGSDSSATFGTAGTITIEQPTKKVEILHDKIIVAGTGQIGLGQRFCDLVHREYEKHTFRGMNHILMANQIAHLTNQDFAHTQAIRGQYGALVAFPADRDIHLCEFAIDDFQPEFKSTGLWYASMGRGQSIADPFLGLMRTVFWTDGMPSLQDGIFIATWTLQHAIEVNAGGIKGPIQMAVLTKGKNAQMLTEGQLTEHQENVTGVINHLRSYRDQLSGKSAADIPDVPKL